jgi:hypothetical protein
MLRFLAPIVIASAAQSAAGVVGASYAVRLLIVLAVLVIADSRRPAH